MVAGTEPPLSAQSVRLKQTKLIISTRLEFPILGNQFRKHAQRHDLCAVKNPGEWVTYLPLSSFDH